MLIDTLKKTSSRITAPFALALLLGAGAFFLPRVSARADSATEGASTIELAKGQETTLSPDQQVTRIAVGDPSVADVAPVGGNQVKILGVSAGKTTMLMWFDDGSRVAYLIHVQ